MSLRIFPQTNPSSRGPREKTKTLYLTPAPVLLIHLGFPQVSGSICAHNVPCDDMKSYSPKIFNDFIQPLKAAINRTFTGPNTIATVLFAETLIAFLPSMSTYNVTYDVLKEYQIVPLQSGAMQRNRRISLAQFADARAGFLEVNRPHIQRIFIPLETFPTPRRGRIIELIKFLNSIQTINRGEIAAKASKIILIAYFEDLEPTV